MPKKRFQRQEREGLGWMSGLFTRKRRSTQDQEHVTTDEHNTSKDSRLMRRNKVKNLHSCLSEIMRKLKHSFKKEKPQHDNNRLLSGNKRRFQRSLSTKDHFFLERMTSISYERSPHGHNDNYRENEDFHQNWATSEEEAERRRIVEISEVEANDGERGGGGILKETSQEESQTEPSLISAASQTQTKEEYKVVKEPQFIEHDETSPAGAGGEAKQRKDEVFKYVKAVLDATNSNWEELCLKTESSQQLLNPALISNIPNQLGIDQDLLFDCINEVLFDFCRFPPSAPHSLIRHVQQEVYAHLFPLQFAHSLDQIIGKDMAKPKTWFDITCGDLIASEATEIILNELLDQLMLDL